MPKVSVIIPTYNRKDYLSNSVGSVLEQTFQDFELIISDDASTDSTRQYVESLSDPRIIYIFNETNRGVAETRNNALKIARGKYVAFLDDDDEWLPEKLRMQVELIERKPLRVGAIYTGVTTFDVNRNHLTSVSVPEFRGNILNDLLTDNFLATSSILIRKSSFDRVGFFDTEFKGISDFDMWIRIAGDFDFDYIKDPLVKHQVHDLRITENYEAVISGLKLLLSKHNKLYAKHKKAQSSYKLKLGIFYCYNNDTKEGRRYFIEAIKLYPLNLKHYYNFALSILGTKAFMAVKHYRLKILYTLRGT